MTEHVALPLGDSWVAYVDASDCERVSTAGRWRYKIVVNRASAVRDMAVRGMSSTRTLESFILQLLQLQRADRTRLRGRSTGKGGGVKMLGTVCS
jgi:hypothetical protein